MICSADFTHNFWCTHWHTLSPTRKTATTAFICSRIDREFASSAQSSNNQQNDENDLGILKLIGGNSIFSLTLRNGESHFNICSGWYRNRSGTSVDYGVCKSNNSVAWPMEERPIRHRKSRFVFFARLPVVNWLSDSVAKSANARSRLLIGSCKRLFLIIIKVRILGNPGITTTANFFVLNVQMKMKKYLSKVAALNEQKTKYV